MSVILQACVLFLATGASAITFQHTRSTSGKSFANVTANSTTRGDAETVEQIRLSMVGSPKDLQAQQAGCEALRALADTQREGPGPWGGRQVSTNLLNVGIGEAFAQGLLNAVAIERALGQTSPGPASLICFAGIRGLTVQNSYDKGLALISHAPHLWEAIVSLFRAFNSSDMVYGNLCIFAALFGTPQPALAAEKEVEAGGIDFVMKYLEDESLKSDPELFQRVYCALSDPVHERSGAVARAIANYGGPLQGISTMVRSLRWAKESKSTFHEANGFGLLYEGVHVAGGVMEHDDANKSFAHAFVKAGLIDQLVPIMREEPGDHLLQDMSCEAIKWITDDNINVQEQLVEMGVLDIIAGAIKRHSHPPIIAYGSVTIACSTALLNFASTSEAWREQLRGLGVRDTLDWPVFIAFPPFQNTDFLMRREWFSNQDIYKLRRLLA